MSEEDKSPEEAKSIIVPPECERLFDRVLNHLGLQTPVDYIFLDFAIQKSRLALQNVDDTLHFLFHTQSRQTNVVIKPFPHSMFLEKQTYRKFNMTEVGTEDMTELILWVLQPSDKWAEREILPFTDFHLYFNEVVKPLFGYSAEDIYRLFDEKKDETFFVAHGKRTSTESKRIITLFVTKDHIIAFHFDHVDVEAIPLSEKFMSKWISLQFPINLQEVHEFAVFERPKYQLVPTAPTTTEKSEKLPSMNFSTQGLEYVEDMDCVNCSS